MKLSPAEARAHADEVRETSLTMLRGLIPAATIDAWNAAFQPLLRDAVAREGDDPNRGAHRYYVTLPFQDLWADPQVIDNDAIMAVVEELVGADGVMCQLASDTPLLGSDHQDLHRDTQLLFPESGAETPPYQLAVNFPLVDVTAENGPMEYAPGTHMLSKAEGLRQVASGEIPLLSRAHGPRRRDDPRRTPHPPRHAEPDRDAPAHGGDRLFASLAVPSGGEHPRPGRRAGRPSRTRASLAALQSRIRDPRRGGPAGRVLPGLRLLA